MKRLLLFVTACVLSCAASAQLVPTKRHVCHARCVGADPDNPKKDRHRQTLKQILDRKAGETDPAKRKTWERAEQEERERHQDELETMCRTVCQDNPED